MTLTSHTPSRRALLAGCLAGATALAGCMVAPVPGAVYTDRDGVVTSTTVYAPVAPPAPYYEVQPALPYPGAVWIGGYWRWGGHRHVWGPGRYEPPRPGHPYVPHRWHRAPHGGWYLQGGAWMR